MLFSGIPFLFYFLPAVLILYFILPFRLKNLCLLLFSLLFYSWGEPLYIFLMMASITLCYFLALGTEKYKDRPFGNVYFLLSVVVSLGALGFFKYYDFIIGSINGVFSSNLPLLNIALPIGISFYTFQLLSYMIDVKRGSVPAQKNFISLALYISMFPQLIAGPIVRYQDIMRELPKRSHSFDKAALGIRQFVIGLSKKVLIANVLGEVADIYGTTSEKTFVFLWMYAISITLQLYFDFSGYSDMAIGLGHIFGFTFMENFNYPFISKSVTEFWRRWHMSLGSWFRDYVYIPMGGNRVSASKWIFNILTVWMLTGLWHGAAWNFVLWGLYFALFLALEKLFLGRLLKGRKVISHLYVFFVIITSFVLFSAPDVKTAGREIAALFGVGNLPFLNTETLYYLKSYGVLFLLGIVGSTPLIKKLAIIFSSKYKKVSFVLEPLLLLFLFVLSVSYLVDGSFNPFLYFRF